MPTDDKPDHTPVIRVRMPRALWDAYGRVCERRGRERAEELLDFVRREVAEHGDDADRVDLGAADAELAERRARKGGRPRKAPEGSQPNRGAAKGSLTS
jgi:hypothetical protein